MQMVRITTSLTFAPGFHAQDSPFEPDVRARALNLVAPVFVHNAAGATLVRALMLECGAACASCKSSRGPFSTFR